MNQFAEIEKEAGPPDVPSVSAAEIDACRRGVYASYEAFLRDKLKELNERRPSLWNRDYSSAQAYRSSVQPMRHRLQRMLGWWVEPLQRPAVRGAGDQELIRTAEFAERRFSL